jgi:hypothetical protein
MPYKPGDPDQPDFSDVPYELRKWLLDYQLLEVQKMRVRRELSDMLRGIKRLAVSQKDPL